MAKKESTFLNMVITLFIVTFVASASLGYIYELTKEPIAKAALKKKTDAIGEIVPEFDNNPLNEKFTIDSDKGALNCYPAKKGGKLVGTAIETFTNEGFSGLIKVMVGLLPDGSIYDTSVIEQKETPGLGTKIDKNKSDFSLQFKGVNPKDFVLKVKKNGGDVDAITAATISSHAFCDAVQRAYNSYKNKYEDILQ